MGMKGFDRGGVYKSKHWMIAANLKAVKTINAEDAFAPMALAA